MSALLAAVRTGGLVSIVITLGASPGFAEAQSPAWLDPTLLEAAKREGSVVVYTSTNEREGLPRPLYLRGVNITLPDGARRTVE